MNHVHRNLASILALALATPAIAAPGSVRDFDITPTPTPTGTAQVQGPVDDSGIIPVGPRLIRPNTPAPAPTATPTAPETSAPSSVAPQQGGDSQSATGTTATTTPSVTQQRTPARQTVQRTRAPVPQEQPAIASEAANVSAQETGAIADTGTLQARDSGPSFASSTATNPSFGVTGDETSPFGWPWILAIVAFAIAVAGLFVFWRQRQTAYADVPEIVPPLARAPEPAPEPAPDDTNNGTAKPASTRASTAAVPSSQPSKPAPQPAFGMPMQVDASVEWLSRSFANLTLKCSINLRNSGSDSIKGARIFADLVTAHGQVPVSEQVADNATQLPEIASVEMLEARRSHEVKEELRLPVTAVRPIRQGKAVLCVPLLRIRVEADEIEPVVQTYVVGMKPAVGTGRLQPFRLDEMAQTYREIDCRPLS